MSGKRGRERLREMRALQGRQVGVALADGSRIDDYQLVAAGYDGRRSLWLFGNGEDLFVPLHAVRDVWETAYAVRSAR
jgi:hypothetical protein